MNDQDESGIHLWLLLSKAARAVELHARRSITALDLCLSDFAVLEALLHKGPLPVNTLGRKVLLTSGSITTAVDRMENRGLVERRGDPGDRRTRVVHLTPEGRVLIRKLFAVHQRDMERAVSMLNRSEIRSLSEGLRKLGRGAEERLKEDNL
jgi:MarR family transcriptional regulator, 2-MHQ and catechol-resistance regulon repressor